MVVNNRKHWSWVPFSHYSFLATMNTGVQNLVISLGAMQRMFYFSFLFIQSLKEIFPVARKYPSTTRKFWHLFASVIFSLSSLLLPSTTTWPWPYVFLFLLRSLTNSYFQIKKMNDQTVLKFGSDTVSPIYSFLLKVSLTRIFCITHGSFNPDPHPRSNPLLSLLQSGDQKGELVTTTVRDYDLSETSKLVRPYPASLILLHSQSPHASSVPHTWVSPWWVSCTSTFTSPSPCSSSPSWVSRISTMPNPLLSISSKNPLSATSNTHSRPLVFLVQVRSVYIITFFSLSLTPFFHRISCRAKKRRCCCSRIREEDWKERGVITYWKESASADSWIYGRFVPSCIDWMAWYLQVLLIPTVYPSVLREQLSVEKKKNRSMHTGTQFFVEMFGSRRIQSLVLVHNFKLFVVSGVYESGRKNHLRLDKALMSIVYSTRRNIADSYLVPARERNGRMFSRITRHVHSKLQTPGPHAKFSTLFSAN